MRIALNILPFPIFPIEQSTSISGSFPVRLNTFMVVVLPPQSEKLITMDKAHPKLKGE
jgi:hypothetical protein